MVLGGFVRVHHQRRDRPRPTHAHRQHRLDRHGFDRYDTATELAVGVPVCWTPCTSRTTGANFLMSRCLTAPP